jgi:hemolysin activation/secretion protein
MLLALAMMAAGIQDSGAIVDRNRIDRAPRTARPRARALKRNKTNVRAAGAPAVIRGIQFQGAKAPGPVAEAAKRFLGKTAIKENLIELASALSAAYEKTDVALYTVAIPEQDFTTGEVTVTLIEGRLSGATIAGDAAGHPLMRAQIAPMLAEAPLSRHRFERQFALMRAIPGLTFEAEFTDPDANGALQLTVTPKQRRSRFSFGFSNRGVDLLGDGQWDAKGEFYGLGTDGDQLTLAASAARDLERYRYYSGVYSIPLDPGGLTLSANAGYLETRPAATPIRGTAKLAGLSLSYPLVRQLHRAVDVSLGVDGIDSDNATLGSVITSERTRALRAGASYSEASDTRKLAFGASVSQGLDLLNAAVTAPFAETRFRKVNAAASAEQMLGKSFVLRANAAAQFTRDALPAAERFSAGGETFGRAFDTGIITADRGLGTLVEFAVRPVKGEPFGESEFYVFVDKVWLGIDNRVIPGRSDYSLGSAGAGLRLRYREKAELGVELSHVIDEPYPAYNGDWRVNLSWRLSL